MKEWWGYKIPIFLLCWLVVALVWAAILAAMQAVGPLYAEAGHSPLFFYSSNIIPATWHMTTPWGGKGLAWLVLSLGGVVCAGACVADWREHVLPDQFTLWGGLCVTAACALLWGWEHALVGAGLGWFMLFALQWLLRRKHRGVEQIGCGDVKFMIVLGAMVGPFGLLPLMAWGCVLVVPLLQIRRAGFAPFGPALALGALLTLALGLRWPLV